MQPGKKLAIPFVVKNDSGEVVEADALPTAEVLRNAVVTTVTATVTRAASGHYGAEFEVPLAWVDGDVVTLLVSATIAGYQASALLPVGMVDSVDGDVKRSAGRIMAAMPMGS